MTITKVYAVVSTAQLSRAHEWYSRLFGRASDLHPMPEVHEWYFAAIAQIRDPDGNQATFAEPAQSI